MVLPSMYLPPVSWFSRVVHSGDICPTTLKNAGINIEACENFHKQTCRNRCYIDSPNGKLMLSIPIDKSNFSAAGKCLMRDVRISRQFDWQRRHWAAFESSYYNSPFFEFLQDDFRPVYEKTWTFLMDLNEALIEKCFAVLDIAVPLHRTSKFEGVVDMPCSVAPPYYQVFSHKHDFTADLSIIDLLFNMGNEAVFFL